MCSIAALRYAELEMLSRSVAAPAAGLNEAHNDLLAVVKHLIGVEVGRGNEWGHISYRLMKYREDLKA